MPARPPLVAAAAAALTVTLLTAFALAVALLRDDDEEQPAAPLRSGVFQGGIAAEQVAQFERWRGAEVDLVLSFVPRRTWSDIEVPDWWLDHWSTSPFRDRMLASLALLPEEPETSLQEGARGAYDAHFEAAARRLVDAGMEETVVRLGHELNGDWFPWTAREDPEAYAAYWRRVVDTMRAVPGQQFTFEWNVSVGVQDFDATSAYPGDEYVDYVGLDVYDSKYGDASASAQDRWQHLLGASEESQEGLPQGLVFWADFAAERDKPLAFSEWGVVDEDAPMTGGGGGGDAPEFITAMYDWFARHDVAYEVYFNQDAGDGAHAFDNPLFDGAARRYQDIHTSLAEARR